LGCYRIAKIYDGNKDKEAADQAKDKGKSSVAEKIPKKTRGKKKQQVSSVLTGTFSAEIIHEDAPLHLSFPLVLSKLLALIVARSVLVRFMWRNSLPLVTNVLGQLPIYFVLSL
jgi:hypothetical protein